MAVNIILRDKEYEIKAPLTVHQAFSQLEILPESVLATRDNELVTEDEVLRDGDVIKLVAVISGG